MTQSGVTEARLPVHRLIFVEQVTGMKFPDYSNYTCVNDVYQDFVKKFLFLVNFAAPIRTLKVKSNTKLWSETSNNQERKLTISSVQKFLLKK